MSKFFTETEVETFNKQGFLLVKQLYSPQEIDEIKTWTEEIQNWPEVPKKYMMYFEDSLHEPKARILSRIENFCDYHREFDHLINGKAMLNKIAELFQEPAVLFKEKINFKMPGGNGFTPHQDAQAGWNQYASLFITVLVSIDESTIENGCLELASGEHQRQLRGELWQPLTEENLQGIEFFPVPTKSGDALFFDSYIPHQSKPNLTDSPRRVLYLTYNRACEGDLRAQYYADKRQSYPPDIEREQGKKYVFKV